MEKSKLWNCTVCGAENHELDAQCQFCGDCQGNHRTSRLYQEGQVGWLCDDCGALIKD